MAFIKIENLFKKFGKVAAVNHVWLEVKQGEILTLLGPSGCGKTTTLRCIAGLERPDEGDIIIDGQPMFSQGSVPPDRKSTRLNSSHGYISYAVFCLKKKKKHDNKHVPNKHTPRAPSSDA